MWDAAADAERDHPRPRGVYLPMCAITRACAGSSPPARGLQRGGVVLIVGPRIIPARAGFTPRVVGLQVGPGDHPRPRGVYRPGRAHHHGRRGSSPPARGLRSPRCPHRSAPGIIPARAGFTGAGSNRAASSADHPRPRGVYAEAYEVLTDPAGSSPPARGLPTVSRRCRSTSGIIPARAGFTLYLDFERGTLPDHPRPRGVYPPYPRTEAVARGSSPPARGLPRTRIAGPRARGIIPARAGFTAPIGRERPKRRIIPARAGFTPGRTEPVDWAEDHPRPRGVYWPPTPRLSRRAGSSPPARGLPSPSLRSAEPAGIIPARAGFTASPLTRG